MAPNHKQALLTRDATYSQRTENVLRDLILRGELKAGERLNEVALAESLGISRGPLREAVQRLASEGLLRTVSHRGSFVRTFERSEIIELYELRAALEMHVVRLVCERASDEDLRSLAPFISNTASALENAPEGAYPNDLDLHLRLMELAGNAAIERSLIETQQQIRLARSISAQQPSRAKAALTEHSALVELILRRDATEAAAVMRTHLSEARDSAISALGLGSEERK